MLGHADGNLANYMWDGERVRLVDFEDSGRSDRAFELAEILEHISTWIESRVDSERLLACFELTRQEAKRLRSARQRRQAERLLDLLN